MTSPIADGVLAATHRLVQQAMSGQWQDVPKTVEERRALLDKLSAGASPQDQQWLSALKQAMAESDAVVASLTPVAGLGARGVGLGPEGQTAAPAQSPTAEVDAVMNMILGK
ncbi:MAG TPA: hypothetical protein VGK58_20440 [Lacipirellulaceae bacterium]